MKKFRFSRFSKSMQALALALLMTSFFSSCKDNKDNPDPELPKSGETKMTNLKIFDSANAELISELQSDNKTWKFMTPLGYDSKKLEKAKITFTLSDKAEAKPASGDEVNLTQLVKVTVTAENGTTFDYFIEYIRSTTSYADILSFSVRIDGEDFDGEIDSEKLTITVDLPSEVWDLRNEAVATFNCSLGASSKPATGAVLDLTKEVKIEVTASDGVSKKEWKVIAHEIIPASTGFSHAEVGVAKTFVELGYPGEVGNWEIPSIEYGDLLVYHAYCGNNIVLMSRVYIETDPASPHCVKVLDKTTLASAGNLNLGSISVSNLKMITSDYKGTMVAAVVNGSETEFFYWKKTTDSPVSIGKMNVNIAPAPSSLTWNSGAGMDNFQVAGDITGNAWITALAPASDDGNHYRIKVTGGQLASSYSTVKTGYSSNDCTNFQMISPLDASDEPSFVIGDTEGDAATASSTRCYINNFAGLTTSVMPKYWQDILHTWWVGSGFSTLRTGGRAPVVSALPINGKTYVTVATGTAWWHAAVVLNSDLMSLAHENLNIAFETNRGWSFGAWADWYYDDVKKEAYLSMWFGRYGLRTYKMTCD